MTIHRVLARLTHQPAAPLSAPLGDDPWSRIMRGEGIVLNAPAVGVRQHRPA